MCHTGKSCNETDPLLERHLEGESSIPHALNEALWLCWPAPYLETLPSVVGSRYIEDWLSQELGNGKRDAEPVGPFQHNILQSDLLNLHACIVLCQRDCRLCQQYELNLIKCSNTLQEEGVSRKCSLDARLSQRP